MSDASVDVVPERVTQAFDALDTQVEHLRALTKLLHDVLDSVCVDHCDRLLDLNDIAPGLRAVAAQVNDGLAQIDTTAHELFKLLYPSEVITLGGAR